MCPSEEHVPQGDKRWRQRARELIDAERTEREERQLTPEEHVPQPDLEAIRSRLEIEERDGNNAGGYSFDKDGWYRPKGERVAFADLRTVLDFTEALIAALRETLPYVCDMIRLAEFAGRGDIDSAIAVRVFARPQER